MVMLLLLLLLLLVLLMLVLVLVLLLVVLCGYRRHVRSVGRRRKRWQLLVHFVGWRIQPFAK